MKRDFKGAYSWFPFQLFVKSRSIISTYTINVLRQLYTDFPSTDPMVRVVMLLTVCLSDSMWLAPMPEAVASFREKLEAIGLLPLTKEDLFNIMINPFVEKHNVLLEYAKEDLGMSAKDIKDLVQDVAIKCLEIGSKVRTSFGCSVSSLLLGKDTAQACGSTFSSCCSCRRRCRAIFVITGRSPSSRGRKSMCYL